MIPFGPAAGVTDTAPFRPRSEPEQELGFARQPMVCWLSRRGLASTGLRVMLSGIFAVYSDKRELQAALQQDYKSFLRLHVGAEGVLTILPVGVEKTCRTWRLQPEGKPSDPWFEPAGPHSPPRLIEPPIRVTPTAAPPA